jgi:hypothetical protein
VQVNTEKIANTRKSFKNPFTYQPSCATRRFFTQILVFASTNFGAQQLVNSVKHAAQ